MENRYRDDDFSGDWARDDYREGFGGYYARDNMRSLRGRGPKNYRRSDARIHEEVNERLTDHPGIDATNVEVTVENGEVTLNGFVDSRYAKRLAENIADRCSGVVDVHNRLKIADRATDAHIGKASE